MLMKTWLLFLAVGILPAISPGPAVLLAISNALRYGPRAVLYSALGNALGLSILGFAVAFGLAAVLAVSAAAFTTVKIIGAAYLVYLGAKLWRDGKAISIDSTASQPVKPGAPLPPGIFRLGHQSKSAGADRRADPAFRRPGAAHDHAGRDHVRQLRGAMLCQPPDARSGWRQAAAVPVVGGANGRACAGCSARCSSASARRSRRRAVEAEWQ